MVLILDNGIRISLDATNDNVLYKLKSSIHNEQELIILPYSMETNDISLCMCQGYTGEKYGEALVEYDEQLSSESKSTATVVCFGLHPFIVGTPAKSLHLKKALQKVKQMPNVSFFNCEQLLKLI
ncbi:unnamed protein product [Rotaria magnacalcarata]|uniref:Uncharacterized protein n=1 Tax=Rotaria magnacalcarata TaxID=392030 RepID=A0A816V7Q6_9BILA|nr:unnamed protein product [Rotaria magnacalcarata]